MEQRALNPWGYEEKKMNWRKTWSNVRDPLLFVLATAGMLLMFAMTAVAGFNVEGDSARFNLGLVTLHATNQSVYPQSIDSAFVLPQAVDIQVPPHVSSDLETGLNVFVSMPTGCYSSRIKVEHIDDFTHRLTPILIADDKDCVRYSRFDHQVVSLGQLLPGQHEIVVTNTVQPFGKKTIWVTDADLSASNKPLKRQTGG